ncbi:MAG: cbb3-type cytochrome c oxidase subunit I [Acidimicrobiia bacterium]
MEATQQQHSPMLTEGFSLDSPGSESRQLATGWLMLALSSLVIGGLLTVMIVLSRTPGIQDIFPWIDFFETALVVHVNVTVLVWFLSFAGILWSFNSSDRFTALGWTALSFCVAGTALITAAPFVGAGQPLLNNYVPVLEDPIFFVGLGLFGLGLTLLVLRGLALSFPIGETNTGRAALRFGLFAALVAALISVAAVIASWLGIPDTAQGESYYELLFWGGGHTIQFTYVLLMLVTWLWLSTASGAPPKLSPRIALLLFALGVLPALATPYIYLAYDVGSVDHTLGFTWLMRWGGGLAALPLGIVIVLALVSAGRAHDDVRPERNALVFSILLFGVGGAIGFLISGSNVTIPAHYHGSVIAVTVAFMGITYHMLPRLGFRKPKGRSARMQPVIYGTGQLMHVFGLAFSGGYGVQRKTAGSAQGLESLQQIGGMTFMGLGGLLAVIGGIIFLVVVFKAMWPRDPRGRQIGSSTD